LKSMSTVFGLIGFVVFIACVIALAAGVTWIVVKVSPTKLGRKPPVKSGDSS
jgi:hypothetical protein